MKTSNAQTRIKVVHVLTDTNIGGAGTLLYNTIACGNTSRFEYVVVLPMGSRLIERLSTLPCRVLTVQGGRDRSFDMSAISEYVRLFRRERPDIVHTHASFAARVAGRLSRVPVCIYTRHCVFPLEPWQKSVPFRFAFRQVSRLLSDRVVAVAEAARDQLIEMGMDGRQIEVIINGVLPVRPCRKAELDELRQRLGLEQEQFVVGMSARLEEYKGQGTLLRAVAMCREQTPNMRVLLVGDGSCTASYRQLARELGIEDAVIFAGFVEDMAPYYAIINVNVNASFGTETSSLALSEGMSVGVPCVASRYGGNPYMVREGENGFLFEPKNHAELAQTLVRLYHDAALLARLSEGARRQYRERFGAERMTRSLERLYTDVWRERKGQSLHTHKKHPAAP